MGLEAAAIKLTTEQRELLNQIGNGRTSERAHAERAQIILLCAEGKTNYRIGKELAICEQVASKWRKRWQLNARQLSQAETEEEKGEYRKRILKLLDDAPRRGCPGKFSAEQVCHILSVACESPEESEHATELHAAGIHVVSCDEKTGIQALEREITAMRPGQEERQDNSYERHGTQCLIANFEVATGKIVAPTIGDTRTEEDFVRHVQETVRQDPQASFIFVVDQLNTHKSAGLVEWVSQCCDIETELGIKGEYGVLENMETRRAFLSDPAHRIRFVYTPKHASWLNQVEIWFSILVRRLLKRLSVKSTDELKQKITAFIDYFNRVMAKPFKWTYKGRPLQA